jgi:two-component system phosphate regulon response regulator PhoB
MKRSVVIIEDEKDIVETLKFFLEKNQFEVVPYNSAEEFFTAKNRPDFGVYLVDWNLPGIKGTDIIKTIRLKDKLSPIFMISAYSNPDQIVEGLRSGADDYLTKPFNFDELMVRITNAHSKVNHLQENLMNIGIKLIPEAHSVIKDGVIVSLTSREFIIFKHLYENQATPSSRDQLIEQFEKDMEMTARNIDVHIFALRKKVGKINIGIETVWGTGYKLVV